MFYKYLAIFPFNSVPNQFYIMFPLQVFDQCASHCKLYKAEIAFMWLSVRMTFILFLFVLLTKLQRNSLENGLLGLHFELMQCCLNCLMSLVLYQQPFSHMKVCFEHASYFFRNSCLQSSQARVLSFPLCCTQAPYLFTNNILHSAHGWGSSLPLQLI